MTLRDRVLEAIAQRLHDQGALGCMAVLSKMSEPELDLLIEREHRPLDWADREPVQLTLGGRWVA